MTLRAEIDRLRIENESLKRQIHNSTPKRKASDVSGGIAAAAAGSSRNSIHSEKKRLLNDFSSKSTTTTTSTSTTSSTGPTTPNQERKRLTDTFPQSPLAGQSRVDGEIQRPLSKSVSTTNMRKPTTIMSSTENSANHQGKLLTKSLSTPSKATAQTTPSKQSLGEIKENGSAATPAKKPPVPKLSLSQPSPKINKSSDSVSRF